MPAFVQCATNMVQNNSPGGQSNTVGITATAGDFLLVVYQDRGNIAGGTGSIGDTAPGGGNTWVGLNSGNPKFVNGGNNVTYIWYAANCKGGTYTITANNGTGINAGSVLFAYEASGIALTNPIDQQRFSGLNTFVTITTGVKNTFCIGINLLQSTGSSPYTAPGAGWTADELGSFDYAANVNNWLNSIFEHQIVPAAGTNVTNNVTPATPGSLGSWSISLVPGASLRLLPSLGVGT